MEDLHIRVPDELNSKIESAVGEEGMFVDKSELVRYYVRAGLQKSMTDDHRLSNAEPARQPNAKVVDPD